VPAIRSGSNVREIRTVLDGGDAGESRAVAPADVHRAAAADDGHLRGRRRGRGRFGRLEGSDGVIRNRLHIRFCRFIRRRLLRYSGNGLGGFFLRLLAFIIVGDGIHERLVAFLTVNAIYLDTGLLLESLDRGVSLAAEVTVEFQSGRDDDELVQKLLQGFHIGTFRALLERTGAQHIGGRGRHGRRGGTITIVDEGQFRPVLPGAIFDPGLHASIVETAPFHGIAVADVVTDMAIGEESKANDLGQGADRAPVHALGLAVGEHAVGGLVGAAVGAILAGELLVVADGLQHTDTAARPGVPLAAADAVGHDLLVGDVLLITGSTTGTVVRGVLFGLAIQHGRRGFVDATPVPIGTLFFRHPETPVGKMFVGKGNIDSGNVLFRHDVTSKYRVVERATGCPATR